MYVPTIICALYFYLLNKLYTRRNQQPQTGVHPLSPSCGLRSIKEVDRLPALLHNYQPSSYLILGDLEESPSDSKKNTNGILPCSHLEGQGQFLGNFTTSITVQPPPSQCLGGTRKAATKKYSALACVAHWLECQPAHQRQWV